MTRIAFLPGDGVGREVLPAARRVLEAAGFRAEWVDLPLGWDEWRRGGDALPPATLRAMEDTDCAFLGAITSQGEAEAEAALPAHLQARGWRYESPILRLRRHFDLAINVRPVRTPAGRRGRTGTPIDLVLFRENTEGLYAGIETHPTPAALLEAWRAAGAAADRLPPPGPDTALALRVVTRPRVEALFEAAFTYAEAHDRRRVTLLEKANVLRRTGGLVRQVFQEVAGRHPSVAADELHIDAACARLVRDPARFDVVAATNLFGDIFSDVAAELGGGLGLAPSASLGPRYALFEPVHGSAPDVAGQGVANPLAAVLSGALLARHVGQVGVADAVEAAVDRLWETGPLTPDMGGTGTTESVARALIEHMGTRAPNLARAR